MNKKTANRRYYLNRKMKNKYPIDGRKRTVSVPYSSFAEIPIGDRYYVGQLIKLGYNIQLKLF